MGIEPGARAEVTIDVCDTDTAVALRSGEVDVLATPRLIALCEEAAVAATAGTLEAGTTTVGTEISIQHTAPTPVGGRVTATAKLLKASGRRLKFSVTVCDSVGPIASGEHTRVIVIRESFDAAADERR